MTDNPQDPTSIPSFYDNCFICKQNTFYRKPKNKTKFYIKVLDSYAVVVSWCIM